jgi:hypothetical protein
MFPVGITLFAPTPIKFPWMGLLWAPIADGGMPHRLNYSVTGDDVMRRVTV